MKNKGQSVSHYFGNFPCFPVFGNDDKRIVTLGLVAICY